MLPTVLARFIWSHLSSVVVPNISMLRGPTYTSWTTRVSTWSLICCYSCTSITFQMPWKVYRCEDFCRWYKKVFLSHGNFSILIHSHIACLHVVHDPNNGNFLWHAINVIFNLKIPQVLYSLSNILLVGVKTTKDIGIYISSDMKPYTHCAYIVSKALCLLCPSSKNVLYTLYFYHRPILESSLQSGIPGF